MADLVTAVNTSPIFAIMGPTCSGKTALALSLAETIAKLSNTPSTVEIISVDSALVYRGLDIGTAKPNVDELSIAPHHLIDICDPHEPYSVQQFCIDTKQAIHEILQRGNQPLLVGGTMLYFKALCFGLSDLPSSDPDIRKQLQQEKETQGLAALYRQLEIIDPKSAARIEPNDTQRVFRALEVFRICNKPLSELQGNPKQVINNPIIPLGLIPKDPQTTTPTNCHSL